MWRTASPGGSPSGHRRTVAARAYSPSWLRRSWASLGVEVDPLGVVDRVGEAALDRACDAVAAGRLGGEHDLERVVGVLRAGHRGPSRLDAFDEVAQPLGPLPVGIGLGNTRQAPTSFRHSSHPSGRPVVAEELDGALAAVDLDRGGAVSLHRESGRDDREARVAEVEQHVRVVVGFDPDPAAVHLALRDRDAHHRRHPPRGTEEGAQARDVVDAEVEQRPAAWGVEPVVPPRARPSRTGRGP